jgi:hypothetical protein
MRTFSLLLAAAVLALAAGAASAQQVLSSPPPGAAGNVTLAQAAAPAPTQLLPPPSSQMAQNAGVDDFQFNELDFDRQGAARQAGPPALPGAGAMAPGADGDNLINLFSDQPAPVESLRNLPGVPSPTTTPAAEGQAKIELSQPAKAPAPATTTARRATRRRRAAGRVAPMRPPEAQKGNRWYWASEVWRAHPEIPLSDCQSYVANRPLLNVRCFSTVSASYPQSFGSHSR